MIVSNDENHYDTIKGKEPHSTNNRMELIAPIQALRSLKEQHEICLYTDSTYVKNGISFWIHEWKKHGWLTREKQPVKNKDLWHLLDAEMQRHKITWKWIKGHTGNRWNELADQLASSSREFHQLPIRDENAVHMFIGITCKHTTGKGSWAIILKYKNHLKTLGGFAERITANKLYLETAVQGMLALKRPVPVYLYTTSGYLRDGATEWISGWMQRNWVTRDGKDVSNKKEWQRLKSFLDNMDVQIILATKESLPCLLQEAKELAREYVEPE